MPIRPNPVQIPAPNSLQEGFRSHDEVQRRPFKVQGGAIKDEPKATNDSDRRRQHTGHISSDYLYYPRQPYAAATKLKDSDYQPRLCPQDANINSATFPCGRPALPPQSITYGKPNRTPQEYGSGWPKYHRCGGCPRQWLDQIYIPPKQHPAGLPGWNILPKYIRPRLPYGRNVGDILPKLTLRQTDVIIWPCVNAHNVVSGGYVGFVKNSESLPMEAGTMLLRIAKSVYGTLRMRECIKLFLRTVDGCWRFKGFLDTENYFDKNCSPSNYQKIPARYQRTVEPNTADTRCIPQRGDIIIHEPWKDLQHTDRKDKRSSLRWFSPTLEIDLNDVLVRMCVWKNVQSTSHCVEKGTDYDGFVELFIFNGIGLGWVFLGRDEAVFQRLGTDEFDDET